MKSFLLFFTVFTATLVNYSQNPIDDFGGFNYTFTDASVAPEYNRNYTIAVEDTVVRFSVDSYGDVKYTETNSITRNQLKTFKDLLKKAALKTISPSKDTDGCTGGTSEYYLFYAGDENKQEFSISFCGGKSTGNVKGKIDDARNAFKALVPDFEKKLSASRSH